MPQLFVFTTGANIDGEPRVESTDLIWGCRFMRLIAFRQPHNESTVCGVREANDAGVSATSHARTLRRFVAPVNMTKTVAANHDATPIDASGKCCDAMGTMKQRLVCDKFLQIED